MSSAECHARGLHFSFKQSATYLLFISICTNSRFRPSKGKLEVQDAGSPSDHCPRVKSDALFSYQPPFNLLAFVILKPASWFITPRQLHSLNVFLIKVTSLPQLIVIGVYERYLADGRKFRETSIDLAQSLYNRLPKHIKNMPLVEALVGSSHNDLFEAIFDVELSDEYDIFEEGYEEDEGFALRSQASRETLRGGKRQGRKTRPSPSPSPAGKQRRRSPSSIKITEAEDEASDKVGTIIPPSLPTSPTAVNGNGVEYGRNAPQVSRLRVQSLLSPPQAGAEGRVYAPEMYSATSNSRSPLARLFNQRNFPVHQSPGSPGGSSDPGLRKIEALLEDVKDLPVQKLKDEMKELQVGCH